MSLVASLLRKNMSKARLIGFLLSNFIGLAIVTIGLQFFLDARSIWQDEDSFIKKDYLVVNKRVTAENTLGASSVFASGELEELKSQPWVRSLAPFTVADFRVSAAITSQGKGLSTFMFLESIPDSFIDISPSDWHYTPGDSKVPVIISKDYLTLYNFGFASSAGMPQLTEGLMSSIPMMLTLSDDKGSTTFNIPAHIAGYSNRLNTILVPQSFMDDMNARLGKGKKRSPSRVIIDVNSPGDVAITEYLDTHNLEVAGDKSGSQASFLLKVVTGIILAVGVLVTVLSFFILMLSISLLMEKNRDKLHTLIMLGYPLKSVGAPFRNIILTASIGAYLLALLLLVVLRSTYIDALRGMGQSAGNLWCAPLVGLLLTLLIILFNVLSVRRKVMGSFRV